MELQFAVCSDHKFNEFFYHYKNCGFENHFMLIPHADNGDDHNNNNNFYF